MNFRSLLAKCRIKYGHLLLFHLDINKEPLVDVPNIPSATIHRATPSEIETYDNYEDTWNSRETMRQRLENGHELFVVEFQGERSCYNWVEHGKFLIDCLDHWFELPENSVNLAGGYTRPRFRNKGLMKYNYAQILHHVHEDGIQHVYLNIFANNAPSIRVAEWAGFRAYISLYHLRVLWSHWFFVKRQGRLRLYWRFSKSPVGRINEWLTPD